MHSDPYWDWLSNTKHLILSNLQGDSLPENNSGGAVLNKIGKNAYLC